MALDAAEATYAAALKVILLAAKAVTDPADFDTAMTTYSNDWAAATKTFIKAGEVIGVQPGGSDIGIT